MQNGSKWTMMAKKTGKAKPGAARKTVRYGTLLFVTLCQFISSPTKPLCGVYLLETGASFGLPAFLSKVASVGYAVSLCRRLQMHIAIGRHTTSGLSTHTLVPAYTSYSLHLYDVMADVCCIVYVYPIVCRLGRSNACGKFDKSRISITEWPCR